MKFLLDLIFPIQCLGCNTWDVWLCKNCQKKIKPPQQTTLPNNKYLDGLFYICEYKNPLIQKLIHQLKYNYSKEIAQILGQHLGQAINKPFDYIIPVPLHKKRFCQRGFNQAELIALAIVKTRPDISLQNNIVIRKKYTQAQAQLEEKQRIKNTANAFQINNQSSITLKNKKILLIDDVYTTGNTLNQVAKILQTKNPESIWAACIAKG